MGDVEVLRWPDDRGHLGEASENHRLRLFIVRDGEEPPLTPDCCTEWMWQSGGEQEFRIRMRQLTLRGFTHRQVRPHIDDLGLLHFGMRTVALARRERLVLDALIRKEGEAMSRAELTAAAWPDVEPTRSTFVSAISRLRVRLGAVGLAIRSTALGYRLEPLHHDDEAPGEPQVFDDELDDRWRSAVGDVGGG